MWEQLIGKQSEPVLNWVERGAVRKFAQAISDPNPLYIDEKTALRSRWGGLIAPPTFPITFDYGTIPDLTLPTSGLIHGEQRFHYTRPLRIGERVRCHASLENAYEKQGSRGLLTFLVISRESHDEEGVAVCTMHAALIVTETVLRGMGL